MTPNLYVHFPFCRAKCAYCALHSRSGVSAAARAQYVDGLVHAVRALPAATRFDTVYFGGGTPALCDLSPLFAVLAPRLKDNCEFTVELHPLDVAGDLPAKLRAGGVNRISMGLEATEDATLADMRRGYDFATAARAFARIRREFDNAGLDLIAGYPGAVKPQVEKLSGWGLSHCSVYSLQVEEGTSIALRAKRGESLPTDAETLSALDEVAAELAKFGLERYEISNYALPGCECRHNLAVWRGEDYLGLGEGACGREGRVRTRGLAGGELAREEVSAEFDRKERALFALRTREGLSAAAFPEWRERLEPDVRAGLLVERAGRYVLTARGTEVCDAILAELV